MLILPPIIQRFQPNICGQSPKYLTVSKFTTHLRRALETNLSSFWGRVCRLAKKTSIKLCIGAVCNFNGSRVSKRIEIFVMPMFPIIIKGNSLTLYVLENGVNALQDPKRAVPFCYFS